MAIHHIAIPQTAAQIETIRSGATASESTWYYDTDNDLLYYHRLSDDKLIGPIGALEIINLERVLPIGLDVYRNLGSIDNAQGVANLKIVVTSVATSFRHSSIYEITRFDIGSSAWQTVLPINGTGIHNSMQLALQVRELSGVFELRLKRITGSNDAITAKVRIYNNSQDLLNWTEDTTNGVDATTQGVYSLSRITQIGGVIGLHMRPETADVDTEIDGYTYMHKHLSVGGVHPWIGGTFAPTLFVQSKSGPEADIIVGDDQDKFYALKARSGGLDAEHTLDSGTFKVSYKRNGSAGIASPNVLTTAKKDDGSGNDDPLTNTEIAFQWNNHNSNLYRVYGNGRIEAPLYAPTLDDTGTETPANFLYSGTNGEFFSAPFGKILGEVEYEYLNSTTNFDLTRNTIQLIRVFGNTAAQVTLPTSGLVKGDRVWVKFIDHSTGNTLTVNAGGSNTIDFSLSSVSITRGDSALFIWTGTGTYEKWHRMAAFT